MNYSDGVWSGSSSSSTTTSSQSLLRLRGIDTSHQPPADTRIQARYQQLPGASTPDHAGLPARAQRAGGGRVGRHEDQVQQGGAQLGQARPGPADTPGTASLLTTLVSSTLVISSSGVGSSVRGRLDNDESVLFACAVFCCKLDLIS